MVTGVNSSGDHPLTPSDLTVAGGNLYFFAPTRPRTPRASGSPTGRRAAPARSPPSQLIPRRPVDPRRAEPDGPDGRRVPALLPRAVLLCRPGQASLSSHDQLWTSDGTTQGTAALPAPAAGSMFSSLGAFEPLGNLLLFQAVETVRRSGRAVEERRHRGGDRADRRKSAARRHRQRPLLFRRARRRRRSSTSPRTTASTARSSGRATGPPAGPGCWPTSTPDRARRTPTAGLCSTASSCSSPTTASMDRS